MAEIIASVDNLSGERVIESFSDDLPSSDYGMASKTARQEESEISAPTLSHE